MNVLDGLFGTVIPVLRRGIETKQGPHRSATPESVQMKNTSPAQIGQHQLSFIREGHVKFTPSQANLVLKMCRYEHQRDESRARGHVATLAEYMRRGQWLEKSQLDFAAVSGRLILVNGHHRMHAQIVAGTDILWNIAIHECPTDEAVRALYYRFDTTLRKRSTANIVSGLGLSDDLGLRKRFAASTWRAATVIARDMRVTPNSAEASCLPDEIAEIVHDYADEAKWINDHCQAAPQFYQKRLETASSLCVALVTLKHCPEEAREFWGGVYKDDGLRKGDPRKTLIADMATRKGSAGLQASLMIAAAKAWNAFYQGRDLKIIRVTEHAVQIDGTPYTVRP